jgi:hypothetical protein
MLDELNLIIKKKKLNDAKCINKREEKKRGKKIFKIKRERNKECNTF